MLSLREQPLRQDDKKKQFAYDSEGNVIVVPPLKSSFKHQTMRSAHGHAEPGRCLCLQVQPPQVHRLPNPIPAMAFVLKVAFSLEFLSPAARALRLGQARCTGGRSFVDRWHSTCVSRRYRRSMGRRFDHVETGEGRSQKPDGRGRVFWFWFWDFPPNKPPRHSLRLLPRGTGQVQSEDRIANAEGSRGVRRGTKR